MSQVLRALQWVAVAVCATTASLFAMSTTHALSWTQGDLTISKSQRYATDQDYYHSLAYSVTGCVWQEVTQGSQTNTSKACVEHGTNFSLAYVLGGNYYVRIGNDSKYYRLQGSNGYGPYFIGSDGTSLVTFKQPHFFSSEMAVTNNVLSHIERVSVSGSTKYEYRITSEPDWRLTTKTGDVYPVNTIGVSQNHRYVVVGRWNAGVMRIDLQTKETRAFSTDGGRQYSGTEPSFGVSNDGKTFVKAGRGVNFYVQTIEDGCGTTYIEDIRSQGVKTCPTVDMTQNAQAALGLSSMGASTWYVRAVDDDMSIELIPPVGAKGVIMTYVKAVPAGYQPKHLQYLAMGDSFSSGEGDTEVDTNGRKYYRAWTDENGPSEEKCHISTRSYPYKIASNLDLKIKDGWQTIACAGAAIDGDYIGSGEYWGQNSRLEKQKNRQDLKNAALSDFIPGRDRQIEFVKKYKPEAITLTGSGNDAGFSDILRACVSPLNAGDTCDYADEDHKMALLASAISGQYDTIRTLLKDIHSASPATKIYYLGYPQFLSASGSECGLSVELSQTERKVFRDAVTYLNDVIEAAAISEGAIYVDSEDAFGSSHELCGDGERYVNGFNLDCASGMTEALRALSGSDQCQESFHPNAKGHQAIADRLKASEPNIVESQACASNSCITETPLSSISVPAVFEQARSRDAKANSVKVYNSNVLAAQKGSSSAAINTTVGGMEPNSIADVYVTSVPTQLGSHTVDPGGTLAVHVNVPDSLDAGYHTLHIIGKTFSGEDVEVWQLVQVFGREGDIDEDGIPDSVDKCYRYRQLNVDLDQDGVDDGCDSSVRPITPTGTTASSTKTEQAKLLPVSDVPELSTIHGSQSHAVHPSTTETDYALPPQTNAPSIHPADTVPVPSKTLVAAEDRAQATTTRYTLVIGASLGAIILLRLIYAVTKKHKK